MDTSYARFMEWSTIGLASMAGCLFALPFSMGTERSSMSLLPVVICTAAGLLAGVRRRKSKLFFYISLVTVLVLSSILSFSVFSL